MAKGQTTDPEYQGKARSRERREMALAKEDVAAVMGLPAGRRFMYRLIFDRCELQSVYLAQDSGIYKHEGRRGVAAELVLDLQINHAEAYILMITERMRELKYDSQIREDPQPDNGDEP